MKTRVETSKAVTITSRVDYSDTANDREAARKEVERMLAELRKILPDDSKWTSPPTITSDSGIVRDEIRLTLRAEAIVEVEER